MTTSKLRPSPEVRMKSRIVIAVLSYLAAALLVLSSLTMG
jgi:hypothetical protein